MLSVADALRAVLDRVPRLGVEQVALGDAGGRVLGEDVLATRALPEYDNSAMDGYAVRAAELPARLHVVAVVAAGAPHLEPVPAGACVRIFTGAPLPADLDTIVIQERATRDGDLVELPAAPVGEHVRRRAEDYAIGDLVMAAGKRLRPWDLAVLAAHGVARVPVVRAPRVALIATGDELVPVETRPGPGQLVNSSAHALEAMITECGGSVLRLGIVRDEIAAIAERLTAALEADVVITTGAVSVGDRDHVHAALASVGITLELWKVAMQPGKPFSFAMRDRTPVFGLPGNPISTIVAFELFLRPALLAMQGATELARARAPVTLVDGFRKSSTGRAYFLRCRVVREGDRLVAHPHPNQSSSRFAALATSNALVEIPAEVLEVPPLGTCQAYLLEAV
ncbi:MAG: gephyrin-like molybdotransferase Glp [Kofleriaceae bacterium]